MRCHWLGENMKKLMGAAGLGSKIFFRPILEARATRTTRAARAAIAATVAVTALVSFSGCVRKKGPLGTTDNPIKLYFVPSVDAKVIEDGSQIIRKYLEKTTGYKFKVSIPASYVTVVEAFGTKRADIAAFNTFGYIMANKKFGAEAKMTVLRYGRATYRGQIVARADSNIKSLKDIAGKKFAFVDPSSTSGYLLPLRDLKAVGVEPKQTVFAFKHDNVITMVYQKQVDAGASFYSPPENGLIQDARRLVKTQFPDVEKVIKIIKLTDAIPNDPIVFRKDLPQEIKDKVVDVFMKYVKTPEGKEVFEKLYGVTGLKAATDKDYDGVREMLKTLGATAQGLMKNNGEK